MFKALGNLASMMKQAHKLGGKMKDINAQLKAVRVTGSAGGDMVVVELNGLQEMVSIKIEPQLFADNERELVEELIPAAVNAAQQKAKQAHAEAIQSMASDVDMSGLEGMFGDANDEKQ